MDTEAIYMRHVSEQNNQSHHFQEKQALYLWE